MRLASVVGVGIALLATAALATPGDSLVVTGDAVNVRAGPGSDYRILVQVYEGEPAVELAREGQWIQVELTDRREEGWIHQSLLELAGRAQSAAEPSGQAGESTSERSAGETALPSLQQPDREAALSLPATESEALARFRDTVTNLNKRALAAAGVELFTGAEAVGGGTVQVMVTEAWGLVPEAGQRSYTNALFDRWQAAAGGGGPLRVQVVDPTGKVVSEKSGP
jgi:Bacterial SH3 domain